MSVQFTFLWRGRRANTYDSTLVFPEVRERAFAGARSMTDICPSQRIGRVILDGVVGPQADVFDPQVGVLVRISDQGLPVPLWHS